MSNPNLFARSRSFSQGSFRKRMAFSNSGHQSQRQLIKSTTMTTFKPKLQRLIQEGKIQQIINSDRHLKGNLLYSTHINQMEKQLGNSKKKLSSMVLKAKTKQFNINKLKNEMGRLLKQKDIILDNNQRIAKVYSKTLGTLQSKKQSKQVTQWIQKTYIHMKDRLLNDEYFHKISYELKQNNLEEQRNRKQFLQKKSHQIINHTKQLQKVMSEAKQICSQQTFHKNQMIDLINHERLQKQFLHVLRIDKQKKEASINQLSAWVIEKQQLQRYLNIFYTHRILREIIHTKNNKLMDKYSEVQKAYLRIKSNTNIGEFSKILKKMEEQDLIYDVTIKKVSDLEQQLQEVQKRLQEAKKVKHTILSRGGTNTIFQKFYYRGIQKDKYELMLSKKQKLEFKITQDQILNQKIINWGNKLFQKTKINIYQNQPFQNILKQCIKTLK